MLDRAIQNKKTMFYQQAIHCQNKDPLDIDKAVNYYEKIITDFSESKSEPDHIVIQSYLNLGKIFLKIASHNPTYYDRAETAFGAIAQYSLEADFFKNDIKLKKLGFETDPIRRKILREVWLIKIKKLAEKGFNNAKIDLGCLYLKIYGENPYFDSERDLVLAERYLVDAFLKDANGTAAFFLYHLYQLKNQPSLANKYLKISADKEYIDAEFLYGEQLFNKKNNEGIYYITRAIEKRYPAALFWDFKSCLIVAENEKNPHKSNKLKKDAYCKLEFAAMMGSVEAQLIAARCALENRYGSECDTYEKRMQRAKIYLNSVISNKNYLGFPNLTRQKEQAEKWLSLLNEALETQSIFLFDETGTQAKLVKEKKISSNTVSPQNETNETQKKKTRKKKKKPVSFPRETHKQSNSLLAYLSDATNFVEFVEDLVKKEISTENKKSIALVLPSLATLDSSTYELLIHNMFMTGKAASAFSILLEYEIMPFLFPIIDFKDQQTIQWLQTNFTKTDETYARFENESIRNPLRPKRNLSITFVCGYLLATVSDVSDYLRLINLNWVPELARTELTLNNSSILLRFIATRHPELDINPYLVMESELPSSDLTQLNLKSQKSLVLTHNTNGFFAEHKQQSDSRQMQLPSFSRC